MGRFVNPDNGAFQVALNSQIYVDKTGLLEYTNQVMDTENAFICNSRPRRFRKSLIHLGYLAYDQRSRTAFIPNEEIRMEFADAVEDKKWTEFTSFQREMFRQWDSAVAIKTGSMDI